MKLHCGGAFKMQQLAVVAFILSTLTLSTVDAFMPTTPLTTQSKGTTTTSKPSLALKAGVFDGFFKKKTGTATLDKKIKAATYETRVIDPDFRLAALFLTLGLVLDQIPYIQFTLGLLVTLLGVLFLVQTFRICFIFDNQGALELVKLGDDGKFKSSGENIVVGGMNRWQTDTIVNYDFFPKGWIDESFTGPVLVYFKETQTPSDSWNTGPGKLANNPEKLATGEAVPGQVHFFPAICNAKQFREEMEKRNVKKIS